MYSPRAHLTESALRPPIIIIIVVILQKGGTEEVCFKSRLTLTSEKMFAGEVKLVHALRFALKCIQTAKVLTANVNAGSTLPDRLSIAGWPRFTRGHAFAAMKYRKGCQTPPSESMLTPCP